MIEWELHPELFLLLPHLAFTRGECDADCPEEHTILTIGWLVVSLHFYF